MEKYIPPKTKVYLGTHADSAKLTEEEAKQLIRLPIRIMDDKNTVYTLSSYQFIYKRRIITEDEETGKTSASTSMVADVFKTTPLPDIWITTITDELQPGEELLFFDVVAKDAKGRLFFAPTLKIGIK